VCGQVEESHDGSEAADEDGGDCEEREMLCGMDTVWDKNSALHVALNIFLGKGEDKGDATRGIYEPSLSCVYSPAYLYTLIYPHILSSLERSLEALGFEDDYGDDGNDKEEEKGADDGRDERRAGGQEGVRRSVEALRRLLWKVPSVGKGRGARYLNGVIMEDGPLSPVECN